MTQTGSPPGPAVDDDNVLVLPETLQREIIAHARRDAPRESCGVVSGQANQGVRLHHLTNLAEGNRLYEIDPVEIYNLEFRELPALGSEIVAIYHSHPVTEAYPSPTDQAQAFWPNVIYAICSLADPLVPVIRAFRLGNDEVTEVTVVFE